MKENAKLAKKEEGSWIPLDSFFRIILDGGVPVYDSLSNNWSAEKHTANTKKRRKR